MPRGRCRRDDKPERTWFPYLLPNGQQILVYKDSQGVLLTDHGGPTRPVADVCREVLSNLSRDPPPPVEDSDPKRPEEDQETATPNPGPSPAQYTEEDQPAPQQTPTPNPGPSQTQYVDDLLNRAFDAHNLQLAQRLKELLDSTTPVESSITNASSSSLPQSLPCEVSNLLESELSTSPSLSSCVFSLTPTGLLIEYFVRVDKGGFFHTYPGRDGPFQSLQEAQQAIDSYHVVGRKNLCMDGLSSEERSVRYALYWPHDGTRRNSEEAFAAMVTRDPVREVVEALLDKYNEDNGRLGDLAYELEEIVRHEPCFDGKGCAYKSYSHLNMTMKTKGADDPRNKLYFAEVTCMIDKHEEYLLTCISTVEPDDNGECLVCGDEMKHPIDAEYKHGRSRPHVRCCSYVDADTLYDKLVTVRDEAWLKAEEARVRLMFKEVDQAIKEKGMLKEVDEAIEVGTIGDGHGKSAKYVVPARRK